MKKSSLTFAALFGIAGAIITCVNGVTATWDFHIDPHGWVANTWFSVGMFIESVGSIFANWVGPPQSASRAQWILLEVATNTVICSLVGAFVGMLAAPVFARRRKSNEPIHERYNRNT